MTPRGAERLASSGRLNAWSSPLAARHPVRLGGWSDGYITDTVYTDQFNVDLCPAWLSMSAVLHGQPSLDLSQPLVWLDLGCGTGLAACAVAAAHPDIEVWGIDYNPAHVERARHLARSAGLANCTFVEASFDALAADRRIGPPDVDVAVVNGVYSWVRPENQRHIVDVIGGRLRPGGLVNVMYEVMPGWSSMPPVAEALRLLADADGRRGEEAFHDAAAALVELRDDGAAYFPMGPSETTQMDGWAAAEAQYGAHEYLGEHFTPLHAIDVFAAMAEAKCRFLGSVHLLDGHPRYSVSEKFADVFRGVADPLVFELVRDLVLQTALRRDLFRRGLAVTTALEQEAWLDELEVRGVGRAFEDTPFSTPAMQVALDPAYHRPLVEALATGAPLGVRTVREIHPEWGFEDGVSALALLVAAGYAVPTVPGGPSDDAVAACRRLNRVLAGERSRGRAHALVVAPSSGAMVELDLVEALALDALWEGVAPETDALVEHVAGVFEKQGLLVRHEGEFVKDGDKAREIMTHRVTAMLDRRDALEALGIT